LPGTFPRAAAQVISVTPIGLRGSRCRRITLRTRWMISRVWFATLRGDLGWFVNGWTATSSK
jgi:hypothetical protein